MQRLSGWRGAACMQSLPAHAKMLASLHASESLHAQQAMRSSCMLAHKASAAFSSKVLAWDADARETGNIDACNYMHMHRGCVRQHAVAHWCTTPHNTTQQYKLSAWNQQYVQLMDATSTALPASQRTAHLPL